MRTVEDLFSACGAYRLTRIQEFRPDATVQHAIVARVGDGAVLLELADAGCRVDTCFFDAERPGLLHLCVSRLDGSLPCQGFSLELAAGVWTLHDGGRDEPLRGDLASLQAILRGAPLPATTAPGTPLPSMAESPPFASPPSPPPPECAPPAAARTFGELELAPGRRYRVLAPIPAAACRELAVGELVVFLGHSFFARESGYTLQFAGGPRQWFELRLSDDDPRDSALLGSLHRHLAPA
jgi:hypothetical protein